MSLLDLSGVQSGDQRLSFMATIGSFICLRKDEGNKGNRPVRSSLCLAFLYEDASFEPQAKVKSF